ncbi:MAG TPA: hypothetical protein VKB95_07810, partial [Chitinophagaceae bacterium]|nr:hypothetical protein [Chitinophagaceae bacterium]
CSKTIFVLKENRLYALVAESSKQQFDSALTLLETFAFDTYKKIELKKFESPEKDFTVLMPAAIHSGSFEDDHGEDTAEKDTLTKNYYGSDFFSSFGFNIISEQFEKYHYYGKGESEYFTGIFKALFIPDSTLNFKLNWNENMVSASAKAILAGNDHLSFHAKVILNGNMCYTLSCFVSSNAEGDSLAGVFFNSFNTTDHKPVTIFTSHLTGLLDEIRTADTSKTEKLLGSLTDYDTSRPDTLPLIKALQFNYADDTSSAKNVRYHIYDKLFDAQDSNAITSRYVAENYERMGANPYIRILALSKLAIDTTEHNYKLLKQWLLRDKPQTSSEFGLYTIFTHLYWEKNSYAKLLYPELLDLASDEYYRNMVYYTTCRLLRDTILVESDIAFAKDKLVEAAVLELEKVISDPKFDNNGYFGDLNSLVYLANNFIDNRVTALNLKIINKSIYSEYADCLDYLTRHKVKVDMKLVNSCLEKPDYRYDIYKILNPLGQFPARFMKQQYFAESDLYNYLTGDEDYVPDKIEYAFSLEVEYHKEKKKMYIYRVTYEDYETQKPVVYLAWAGPFAADENVIDVSGGALTGSKWDKWNPDTYKETVLSMLREADKEEAEKPEEK